MAVWYVCHVNTLAAVPRVFFRLDGQCKSRMQVTDNNISVPMSMGDDFHIFLWVIWVVRSGMWWLVPSAAENLTSNGFSWANVMLPAIA